MALVSVWYQRNNDIIGRMVPTNVWYELASNIIFHAYYYNNSYINYGEYKARDMQAVLNKLASLYLKLKFYIISK